MAKGCGADKKCFLIFINGKSWVSPFSIKGIGGGVGISFMEKKRYLHSYNRIRLLALYEIIIKILNLCKRKL
jgi:hypothetical protein